MLQHAGAPDAVVAFDTGALADAMPAVEAEARRMLAIGHPVPVG